MNCSVQCCLQGLKQNWRILNILHLTDWKKCTKMCVTPLSQVAPKETNINYKSTETGRAELVLLKNILSIHHLPENYKKKIPVTSKDCRQLQQTVTNHYSGCRNTTNGRTVDYIKSTDSKEQLLFWEDILLKPRYIETVKHCNSKASQKLMTVKPKTWYSNGIHDHHKKMRKDYIKVEGNCLEFNAKNMVKKETKKKEFIEKGSRGPSPEQLSVVLLRLREELPHFFEGRHRYSIYSEDILFVNKLTRTTTRSLKAYKFLMNSMQYSGRLFWNNVSLEILQITKHPEDNTIKLRWTAKGIPWYYIPFYILTGKPQSNLFYRYVDGFSIFEVGRDGLVHCHRLDKVVPSSTLERQRWSLRAQILTLLGLAEMDRGACEACRNGDILKKA